MGPAWGRTARAARPRGGLLCAVLAAVVIVGFFVVSTHARVAAQAANDTTVDEGAAEATPAPLTPGSITLSLVSEPAGVDATVSVFVQGFTRSSPGFYANSATLAVGETQPLGAAPPGRYFISAFDAAPPSVKLIGVECSETDATSPSSGGQRGASVGLDPGESVSCTFAVAGPGTIAISVATDPPGGQPSGADAVLDIGVTGDGFAAGDSVPVGGTWQIDEAPVGRYRAAVLDTQERWVLVAVDCDESDAETSSVGDVSGRAASIGVDPGEEVRCTFTLGEPGDIVISLVSKPLDTEIELPFSIDGGGSQLPYRDVIDELAVGTQWEHEEVPVGPYFAVTPPGSPLRWKLLEVECTDSEDGTPSEGDAAGRSARIGLDPAELVVCTFTVAGPGHVQVALASDLPGADGSLDFVVTSLFQSVSPSATVAVGETWDPGKLPPDVYRSQALPDDRPGQELLAVECQEADPTTTSSGDAAQRLAWHGVDPGEDVLCTYTIAGLPREGPWRVRNGRGSVVCDGETIVSIAPSTGRGRIAIRRGGKRLVGRGIAPDDGRPIRLDQDPDEPRRYVGRFRSRVQGVDARFTFTVDVVTARRMQGDMKASVRIQGRRCTVTRPLTLTYAGSD